MSYIDWVFPLKTMKNGAYASNSSWREGCSGISLQCDKLVGGPLLFSGPDPSFNWLMTPRDRK